MTPDFNENIAKDLFQLWRQELTDRQAIRDSQLNPADVVLNRPEEVELLVRAWFFCGRSHDLYVALFHNLNKMPVIKWLIASPEDMLKGFLQFLPWYILVYRPRPAELHFLVSLYREELTPWYDAIANSIGPQGCQYLMSRTANRNLRQLLKTPRQSRREELFGINPDRFTMGSMTGLYGDKNQCLLRALQMSAICQQDNADSPGSYHMLQALETAEAIFEAGLVADSMAILLDAYRESERKGDFTFLTTDHRLYKRWSRILDKVAPAYAMLEHNSMAAAAYHVLYKRCFTLFPAQVHTSTSLDILDRLRSDRADAPAVMALLRLWLLQAGPERAGEQQFWFDEGGRVEFGLLRQFVDQRKQSQPQETFTLVLAALCLNRSLSPGLNSDDCAWILALCQEFWTWVPSSLFFNDNIWGRLSRCLHHNARQAGDRFMARITELRDNGLQFELQHRPDLFRQRDRNWERNILAGAFLGVR
jgi:hypothetical protein